MSTVSRKSYTAAEYLALERAAEFKSEYFGGEIFAMAGVTREHSLIVSNLLRVVGGQLLQGPCEVHGTDLRVKVSPTGLYTYPDVIIACGELQFEEMIHDTLLNPKVIFEVLSDSTEAYDRGKKFGHYRQIPSLLEFILVSQNEPTIERYVREPDGSWRLTACKGLDAVLELEAVPCRLKLADVYFKISFESKTI